MFFHVVDEARRRRVLVYDIRSAAGAGGNLHFEDWQRKPERNMLHVLDDELLPLRQGRRSHSICHYLAGDLCCEPLGGAGVWRVGTKTDEDVRAAGVGHVSAAVLQIQVPKGARGVIRRTRTSTSTLYVVLRWNSSIARHTQLYELFKHQPYTTGALSPHYIVCADSCLSAERIAPPPACSRRDHRKQCIQPNHY